jgi:DNA-binding GntR family transcriptional regulator
LAISYLASSGLVKVESRRGATVTKLTVPQIVEMMDVLAHLEKLCARLAAVNMTSKELSALKEARNRVFPYLRSRLHRPGRADTCLSEQQPIADAILARDPEAAAQTSREHLRVQQRVFSEFITAFENTGMAAAQFDWVPQKISQLWVARD